MKNHDDRIIIFDTTLRDGEQAPGATLNVEEKITIARQLARLDIGMILRGGVGVCGDRGRRSSLRECLKR